MNEVAPPRVSLFELALTFNHIALASFGGGLSASIGSSGVAERNLNRITVGTALVWIVVIVLLGLIQRVSL